MRRVISNVDSQFPRKFEIFLDSTLKMSENMIVTGDSNAGGTINISNDSSPACDGFKIRPDFSFGQTNRKHRSFLVLQSTLYLINVNSAKTGDFDGTLVRYSASCISSA